MITNSTLDYNSNEDGDFSSELCKFLSTLSTTTGTDFSSLNPQMVKLRETLVKQVAKKENVKDPSSKLRNEEKKETLKNNVGNLNISINNSTRKNNSVETFFKASSGASSVNVSVDSSMMNQTVDNVKEPNINSMEKSVGNRNVTVDKSTRKNAGIGKNVKSSTVAPPVHPDCLKVVFSLQSGAGYELIDKALEEAFSQYGEVTQVQRKGERGSVKFRIEEQANAALNKLVQVGDCTVHTSLPRSQFSTDPVPFQVLVDPSHFPRCWERTTKIKAFFTKHGKVLAIDWFGPGQYRAVISFKDSEVAQKLIGQEFLLCPSIQEVSTKTMKGLHEH